MEIPLYYHLFYSSDSGKSKYPHDAARIKHERSNFFQLNILPQKKKKMLVACGITKCILQKYQFEPLNFFI